MNRIVIVHLLLLTLFVFLGACDIETPSAPAAELTQVTSPILDTTEPFQPHDDACWQAARHVEDCTGTWQSPPSCTDAGRVAAAQTVLALSCESLSHMPAKADGWLCDWFGIGCPPDPVVVTASGSCSSDSQCGSGEQCVEGDCFDGVGTNAFEATLDDLTDTKARPGNDVTLLDLNSHSQTLRAQMIAGAEHSIHLVNLLFENNSNTYDTIDLLEDAVDRGVDVRVIVDSASQYLGDGFSPVTAMVNAGVKVHAFNPAAEWSALRWAIGISVNMRIHEKIMVVDGVEAITGGRNVGNRYLLDGNWRDTDIFVDGPAVADLQRVFLEDWDQFIAWERMAGCPQWYTLGLHCPNANPSLSDDAVFYPKADGGGATEVRVVYSDPRSQSSAHGWEAHLALVKAARTSVKITNAYFVPPKRMRDELKAAEARGVQVTVISNSKGTNDQASMWYAALNFYEELIKAGVSIREWKGTMKDTVHSKSMIVDDTMAIVGSYNLDTRSAWSNSEIVNILKGGAIISDMVTSFDKDYQNTKAGSYNLGWWDWWLMRLHRIPESLL